MENVISQTGSVLTGIVGWAGDILGFVVSQPILLIPIVFGFIGGAIVLIKRFA